MFVFTLIKGEGSLTNFFSKIPRDLGLGNRRTSFILDRLEYYREGIFYLYILIEVNILFKLTLVDTDFFEILTVKDVSLPYDLKRIDFNRAATAATPAPVPAPVFNIQTNVQSELTIILGILDRLKGDNLIEFTPEFVRVGGSRILRLSNIKSSQIMLIELFEGLKLHPLLNSFQLSIVLKNNGVN